MRAVLPDLFLNMCGALAGMLTVHPSADGLRLATEGEFEARLP